MKIVNDKCQESIQVLDCVLPDTIEKLDEAQKWFKCFDGSKSVS